MALCAVPIWLLDIPGMLAQLSDKIELVPDFIIRMFGLGEMPDFTKFPAYFNLCMFYMQVKLCTVTSLMGCARLIGEETDGTIEFIYGCPVPAPPSSPQSS